MDAPHFARFLRQVAASRDRRALLGLLGGALLASLPTSRVVAAPHPACVPDCAGKACGDDGCGGSCGRCPGSTTCGGGGVPFQCGGGNGCRGKLARQKGKKEAAHCRNVGTVACVLTYAGDLAEAAVCSNDFDNCCALYAECLTRSAAVCINEMISEYGLPITPFPM